ncbi:hypothetical protein A9P82_12970 [Arachidicoccus ginsenosidimutans]|nr:hypothetical protein A9P82_12970 [Arachidicoccus sp. BS20]
MTLKKNMNACIKLSIMLFMMTEAFFASLMIASDHDQPTTNGLMVSALLSEDEEIRLFGK